MDKQNIARVIFGIAGDKLTQAEREFFTRVNPYGYILFERNCKSPEQVKALVAELKAISGRDNLPILIDQEGGRVARLKGSWPRFPAAGQFASLAQKDREKAIQATYLNGRLIAHELHDLGITVDCAPVADVPTVGAHDVIGACKVRALRPESAAR